MESAGRGDTRDPIPSLRRHDPDQVQRDRLVAVSAPIVGRPSDSRETAAPATGRQGGSGAQPCPIRPLPEPGAIRDVSWFGSGQGTGSRPGATSGRCRFRARSDDRDSHLPRRASSKACAPTLSEMLAGVMGERRTPGRIDGDVALAHHRLAGSVATTLGPWSGAATVWPSMTAAVVSRARFARARSIMSAASWITLDIRRRAKGRNYRYTVCRGGRRIGSMDQMRPVRTRERTAFTPSRRSTRRGLPTRVLSAETARWPPILHPRDRFGSARSSSRCSRAERGFVPSTCGA